MVTLELSWCTLTIFTNGSGPWAKLQSLSEAGINFQLPQLIRFYSQRVRKRASCCQLSAITGGEEKPLH